MTEQQLANHLLKVAKTMSESDQEGERVLGNLLLLKMTDAENKLQAARNLTSGVFKALAYFEREWEYAVFKEEEKTNPLFVVDPRMILLEVRNEILQKMREDKSFQYQRETLPHFPILWDINNGYCEEFAEAVCERLPGASLEWLDDIGYEVNHCVVEYDGKYYDAECFGGVTNAAELPIFTNFGKSRWQVFQERGE